MKLTLIRAMTRSAVFELENGLCFRPAEPFTVLLDGKEVYDACNTNVFSVYSLQPAHPYTLTVRAGGETLTASFVTREESFFVDASRYGLVGDGVTDNTARLQAALSTCPPGGTVYLPAGRYRTASLFLKSHTTLYLEQGAVILGDNDRTHYPILPGVIGSHNEVDEYYLTGWEGNPLDSLASLINITQAEDVTITGQGEIDADAQHGDWWQDVKKKKIAWRPRTVSITDSRYVVLHGVTVKNSYSWTIHPMFSTGLDLLDFKIRNPYDAPNTDGIDPESCVNTRIIGADIHVGDDCIAMKASKVFLGMRLKKSCKNTVIRNCLLDKGHGGIVIGSEMSGGVKDMVVTQCLMDHTDRHGGHPVPDGPHRPWPAGQDPPGPGQDRRHRRTGVPQCGDAGGQSALRHQYVLLLRPRRPQRLRPVPPGHAGGRLHPPAGQPDHGGYRGHRRPVRRVLL